MAHPATTGSFSVECLECGSRCVQQRRDGAELHLCCPSCKTQIVVRVGEQPPPVSVARHASWYVLIDGQRLGPMSTTSLRARILGGEVKRDDLVWRSGLEAWRPAKSQAALAGAFARHTGPILRLLTPPPRPTDPRRAQRQASGDTGLDNRAVNHSGNYGLVDQSALAADDDATAEWEEAARSAAKTEPRVDDWLLSGAKHLPPLEAETADGADDLLRLRTTDVGQVVLPDPHAGDDDVDDALLEHDRGKERSTRPDRPSVKACSTDAASGSPASAQTAPALPPVLPREQHSPSPASAQTAPALPPVLAKQHDDDDDDDDDDEPLQTDSTIRATDAEWAAVKAVAAHRQRRAPEGLPVAPRALAAVGAIDSDAVGRVETTPLSSDPQRAEAPPSPTAVVPAISAPAPRPRRRLWAWVAPLLASAATAALVLALSARSDRSSAAQPQPTTATSAPAAAAARNAALVSPRAAAPRSIAAQLASQTIGAVQSSAADVDDNDNDSTSANAHGADGTRARPRTAAAKRPAATPARSRSRSRGSAAGSAKRPAATPARSRGSAARAAMPTADKLLAALAKDHIALLDQKLPRDTVFSRVDDLHALALRVYRRHFATLHACDEMAERRGERAQRDATFVVRVDGSARANVKVSSDHASPRLRACYRRFVSRWRFPSRAQPYTLKFRKPR